MHHPLLDQHPAAGRLYMAYKPPLDARGLHSTEVMPTLLLPGTFE